MRNERLNTQPQYRIAGSKKKFFMALQYVSLGRLSH